MKSTDIVLILIESNLKSYGVVFPFVFLANAKFKSQHVVQIYNKSLKQLIILHSLTPMVLVQDRHIDFQKNQEKVPEQMYKSYG